MTASTSAAATLDVALPAGFIDRTTPDEDRPVFEDEATGDEIFIYPADACPVETPRFAATATIGGRCLEIQTDEWGRIEAFLAIVAEWRKANDGWWQRVAALGAYLPPSWPSNVSNEHF